MTDLKSFTSAQNFLKNHAKALYRYATVDRERVPDHVREPLRLCVVTGYHKMTHWGMMVLSRKGRFASSALSVEFPLPPTKIEANASYGFEKSAGNIPGATSMKRGPDDPGLRNQCVFVRGFHITGRRHRFVRRQELDVVGPNDRPLRLRGGAGPSDVRSENSEPKVRFSHYINARLEILK
jgi:hypothetical protein